MSVKTRVNSYHELRKPDSQGRIAIGKEHVDETFSVEPQPNGDILLRPVVVLHRQEAWLFSNPEALTSVRLGMKQAVEGPLYDLGDFSKYLEEPDDEE